MPQRPSDSHDCPGGRPIDPDFDYYLEPEWRQQARKRLYDDLWAYKDLEGNREYMTKLYPPGADCLDMIAKGKPKASTCKGSLAPGADR